MHRSIAFLLAGLLSSPAAAAPAPKSPIETSFEALKSLAGTWRRADAPDSPLRIRFALTAGGTVVTEEWLRGDRPHSLTVYHRDGMTLVATHYCPQGNQPRLTLASRPGEAALRFAFRDATDLDPAKESYLVALSFNPWDGGKLLRRETYRQGHADEPSELTLVRD